MSDEPATNGNGVTTPVTPKMSGLALTEYTVAPTPPSERSQRVAGLPPNWGIPDAFLLPNGYPDVRPLAAIIYRPVLTFFRADVSTCD